MTGAKASLRHEESPLLDAENPWPGLAPFDEAQADYFYGRTREVEDLFRRVRLNLLTVLYGQSGLGKTSLVSAALYPRLRKSGMLPVAIRLDSAEGAPAARSQIWQALATALQRAGVQAPPLAEDQTLWEYFHQRSLELSVSPVLVFDQFEELFTLSAERAGGGGFVRDCLTELAALIENRPPDRVEARFNREPKLVAQYDFDRRDYRLLLSLREDYLAHLHDLSGKIPSIALNNMRLTPLDGPRALEAVERPGGKLVAPGAAEAIVRVVAGARDERAHHSTSDLLEPTGEFQAAAAPELESLVVDPALLSLLCSELNKKRREERLPAITPELVEANRENILNNFYARCLADLPEAVQVFVEEDLLTESGFRETLAVDNAEAKLRRRGGDPRALAALVKQRLLHYEQRGAVRRVELTHDVLAPVVRQSRALRREREAIQEAEARKRRDLEENERLAQQARAEAEAKYERSKRQRRLILLFGVAMAAVAAVAVYQGVQAGHERDRSNQLVQRIEAQNAALEEKQKALTDTTVVATQARDSVHLMLGKSDSLLGVANSALATSAAMLNDFCSYGLRVINRFGDSTAGNKGLTRAYNSLVEISDTSVEAMVGRSPAEVCPRQLDTRIESISPALLLVLGDTAGAQKRGRRGLEAARYLQRYSDARSRQVLNQTYSSLAMNLYFAKDDAGALQAAREGLPFAAAVDPGQDEFALDRHARLYHYGALALLRLHRPKEARVWTDSGLTIVARGRRLASQNKSALLYTESQLQLRNVEVLTDSTVHDTVAARRALRTVVELARTRHAEQLKVGTLEWLARMHGMLAEYSRDFHDYNDALAADDSAIVHWGAIVRQGRRDADTVMIVDGLNGMVRAFRSASLVRRDQSKPDLAILMARAAVDSARSLVQVQANEDNSQTLTGALHVLAHRLEDGKLPVAADSGFRAAIRIDSLLLERGAVNEAGLRSDLQDYTNDLDRVLTSRLDADTTGAAADARPRLLRLAEERRRPLRETIVWLRRRSVRRSDTPATRDSLSSALGNLSWTYLLVDRPEQATEAAREGMTLSTANSFILPNYFNALVMSGHDEEAEAFFKTRATQMVEAQPVLFACAVLRDILELRGREVATERHVAVVERLAAPYRERCPKT